MCQSPYSPAQCGLLQEKFFYNTLMNKSLVLPTLCVSRRLPFANSRLKYMLICVLPVVLLSKFPKVKPPFHIALSYRQKARQLRETPYNTRWISSNIRDGMAAHANARPIRSRMLHHGSLNTRLSTNTRKRDFTIYQDHADGIPYPPNTKRAGQSVND